YKNTKNIIIYFQDNGVKFNINKHIQKNDYNLEQIGINLTNNISENIEYDYNLNLNNTKIILPL
ncbi:MAG: hypothetical protein Q4Q23_02145, partial [Methanobacteriaceae archaeon]|nr:hypothetical protein [Methanobacteriaceae archaeon]